MNDQHIPSDQGFNLRHTSPAQRGLDQIGQQLQGTEQIGSDQQRLSDQALGSGDASQAQRGLEQIGQQINPEGQTQLADSREQQLPYGETFRQNYGQLSSDFRASLRQQEQGSFQEVAVRDLPGSPEVRGTEDFNHHITYADAKLHTQQLKDVVLPWVRAGAVKDDFRQLDRALGNEEDGSERGKRSFVRTYDLFFGREPIKVDFHTDSANAITDGRHRIYAAKELGISSIPVLKPEDKTVS